LGERDFLSAASFATYNPNMMTTTLLLLAVQGNAIPAFEIPKWLNAEKAPKLSDYRGKVVILHVNPGFC
jgi:hypothetical protein